MENRIRVDNQDNTGQRIEVRRGGLTRRGEAAIAALAVGAVAGAGIVGAEVISHQNNDEQAAAAKSVTGAQADILILDSGTHIRSTPESVNDGASGDTNIEFTVPSGKRVMVKLPLTSKEHPGYVAFEDPRDSEADASKTIVWVNEKSLLEQQAAWLIPQGKGEDFTGRMAEGHFVTDEGQKIQAGEASLGESAQFDNELRYGGFDTTNG